MSLEEKANELYTTLIEELSDLIIEYGIVMKCAGYKEGIKDGKEMVKKKLD